MKEIRESSKFKELRSKQKRLFWRFVLLITCLLVFSSAFGCKKTETKTDDTNKTTTTPETSYNDSTAGQNPVVIDQKTTTDQSQTKTNNTETKPVTGEASEDTLKQQAEKMVEIFGTFTNRSSENYKNLKDLEPFASATFKSWLTKNQKSSPDKNAAFYGVTTKSLGTAVLESTANNVKILVTVRREEITEQNTKQRTFYALIIVELVNEEGSWKVNGLYWQ